MVYRLLSDFHRFFATCYYRVMRICSYARQPFYFLPFLRHVHDVPVWNGLLGGSFPTNQEGCCSGRSAALLALLLYLQAGARSFNWIRSTIWSQSVPKCLHELVRQAHILLQFEHGQWTHVIRNV